jgi:hypothetical protein
LTIVSRLIANFPFATLGHDTHAWNYVAAIVQGVPGNQIPKKET